jgi:guanylate kinase
MTQQGWFDHVVVNEDVVRAADEVAAIIEASRRGRSSDRAPGHPEET